MTPLYFKYRINVRNDDPIERFRMDFTDVDVTPEFIATREAEVKQDLENTYSADVAYVMWVIHVNGDNIPLEILDKIHHSEISEANDRLDTIADELAILSEDYHETRRKALALERLINDKKGTDRNLACSIAATPLSSNCNAECTGCGCGS